MKLDILEISKCDGAKLPFSGSFSSPSQEFIGNMFGFPEPVFVTGEIVNQNGRYFMTAEASATIQSDCARCGKEVLKNVSAAFTEVFTNVETEDDEMITLKGTQIDLDDVVVNNLLENLPEKFLCKEDCKGLCPVCGKDRNTEECDCSQSTGDLRMEIFRKLAEKDEV